MLFECGNLFIGIYPQPNTQVIHKFINTYKGNGDRKQVE